MPVFRLRRGNSVDLGDHQSHRVTKLFHHVLVAWQSVPFRMVENKRRIWITDIVERNVTVQIWIQ